MGEVPSLPRVAVVGSRAAERRYLRCVPSLVEALHARGWALVSGGALGIDGAAHRHALELGHPQLAVLPCDASELYPPAHRELLLAIANAPSSGLLFAKPRGLPTTRAMFASRNAIVVAISQAVVVVQAGARSGSLRTGMLALRRRMPLAAVLGSAGATMLVANGAFGLHVDLEHPECLKQDVQDWLDSIARGQTPKARVVPWPDHLRWLGQRFRERGAAGLTTTELAHIDGGLRAVLEAEVLALCRETSPGRYMAIG